MEKKNWMQTGAVLALVVMMALPGWGAEDKDKKESKRPGLGIVKRLQLNEEQKQKFMDREEKIRQDAKKEMENIGKLESKLKEEMKKDSPDRNVVNSCIKDISAIRSGIQMKRMENLLELKKTLTPEQKVKFNEMLKKQDKRPFFGRFERKYRRK